jgi:hypothetical protein
LELKYYYNGEIKMRRFTFLILTICLLLPVHLLATDWNVPDKKLFKYQVDVDKNVPVNETRRMASINYAGKIYTFTNYNPNISYQISLRILTNSGVSDLNWSSTLKNDIPNLNDLGRFDWDPAPVVYNNNLYLFVGNKSKGISYSIYNPATDTWSTLTDIDINISKQLGTGMSATVINDKLCLVYAEPNGHIHIMWSNDLITWHEFWTGISAYSIYSWFTQITAISTSYLDNGVKKQKLMFAYTGTKQEAACAEYYFADNNDLYLMTNQIISKNDQYESIALFEGTVSGDPSTGNCVQAILMVDHNEGWYDRNRMERWQLKNGTWTKMENNLVKRDYGWAHYSCKLTGVNFPLPDGKNIRQFMCLIYMSNNDWYHPLNVAWAETNRLIYNLAGQVNQVLSGPSNTQYVGYIEGAPPCYPNNGSSLTDKYINQKEFKPISELEFSHSKSQSSATDIGFDVGGSVSFHAGWFKAELSYSFGAVWGTEFKTTVTQSINVTSEGEKTGYYYSYTPVISRAQYFVNDVNGTRLDTIYNYYMSAPKFNIEPVELQNGLDPSDPLTYQNRKGINFSAYATSEFGQTSNSWVPGVPASTGISVESSNSVTNTHTVKLNLEAELGHFFALGVESSFEYTLKTTTNVGDEFKCSTSLNTPVDPNDVTALNYDIFWLKPELNQGINNWWLHEGATDQNTWCITYDVTFIKRKNGQTNESVSQRFVGASSPVQFTTFTAGSTNAGVVLKWQTSKEVNNYGFEVQRSVSGANTSANSFKTIGFIKGQGTSNSLKDYSFTDAVPPIGKTNYRLKQLDTAKNASYSQIQVVEVKAGQKLPVEFSLSQNYPNPFNPTTRIRYQVADNNSIGQGSLTKLSVYDMLGREVAILVNEVNAPGTYEVEWNASKIPSGVYFYRLQSGSFNATKKLLLLK